MRDENYVRKSDVSNCWYKDMCNSYDTDICRETCKKFTQTDYLFQMSNLPKSCWKAQRLDDSCLDDAVKEVLNTIVADCEFFVKKGFNLYLYGETGCGKTSWAIKIMNNYFASIAEYNDFTTRGLYINVASFLRDAKLNMTYKSENYYQLLETIKQCDIVIWDDIGQTDPTNYEAQWLYSFINERLLAKKCNIYTSNLSPQQLEKVDKRLESRICKGSDCLEITGLDMRSNNTYTAFMNSSEVEYGSSTDYK